MSVRLSLVCSLLLVAACDAEPKIIGIANDMSQPDGGPTPVEADQILAQYAEDIAGVWKGERPEVKITFTPSQTNRRSGSAVGEGFSELSCFLLGCPFDLEAGKPIPPVFDSEYWFLRLTPTGALVTLPDPTGFAVAFICTYVPAPERLECGPEGRYVMLRVDPP